MQTFTLEASGTIEAYDAEQAEHVLRDLLKNLEPWIQTSDWKIKVEDVRL